MIQKKFFITLVAMTIFLHTTKSVNEKADDKQVVNDNSTVEVKTKPGGDDINNTTAYLNKKIQQLLEQNPSKNPSQLSLAETFNLERSKLENAVIRTKVIAEAIMKAEKALDDFKNFLNRYKTIEQMLETATKDLSDYEMDAKRPLQDKYKALMLLLKLKTSSTLDLAETALKLYNDFKNAKTETEKETNLPEVMINEEHKKYFEEILNILKDSFKNDLFVMESILKQILMNPNQLKELYDALTEISVEDYDDEDFLEDLWSTIFG